MKYSILILLFVIPSFLIQAKESYEFIGIPISKIGESGDSRTYEKVADKDKLEFQCIITKVDGKYFWKTRENKEMVKVRSGIYITYLALNGAGYVRVIDQEMKKVIFENSEQKFDYKEHMMSGLSSITYYGYVR